MKRTVSWARFIAFWWAVVLLYSGLAHAGEYVAFSLGVAQMRIEAAGRADWRKEQPEVFTVGGITKIRGLVYDRKTGDTILVGERDSKRSILTLDDFVVALRARFIYNQWPLVSIDPTPDTKKTNLQHVRYEGGIEETAFGLDMFDADLRLKKIGQGQLESGAAGLKSPWEMNVERVKRGEGHRQEEISARFWFYPISPSVTVRDDVAAIEGLKVGVFTEVLSASIDGKAVEDVKTFVDPINDEFAKGVSERYSEVAAVHVSIARLAGLNELVALTRAIEEMDPRPPLEFWLERYRVAAVATPREQEMLKRRWDYQAGNATGFFEVSGGVHLTALALRLKAGDVTALKEAVAKTRPKPEALSWGFVVGEWLIPTAPGMLKVEDIVPLFTQAVFLQEKKYYDDSITLYGRIITLKPDWDWAYVNQGLAYEGKGHYDDAISAYSKALKINPRLAEALYNRGIAYDKKGQHDQAISDFTRVLEINLKHGLAYYSREIVYHKKGQLAQAISDYTKALEINPRYTDPYNNRGSAYKSKGQYEQAISDFNKAIEINPRLAEAYSNRGIAYAQGKGQYDQAISDYNKAIEINPRLAEAYVNRGIAYKGKGQYDQAISDYNKAIEINPRDAEAYSNRGIAYAQGKGQYEQAISDFNKAIEINPRYAVAYFGKALVYEEIGRTREAIEAYNGFIQYASPQYASYIERVRQRIRELGQ